MEKKSLTLNRMRWMLRLMGWFKIPMLAFVNPKLIDINETETIVEVQLRRRTKNHLNSMYFGALAVGADVAAGLPVFYFAERESLRFSFSFSAMQADFHKRAESNVRFICKDMNVIKELIRTSLVDKERKNATVLVSAYNNSDELVASFVMGLSVKVQA
jgi:acyl-coenzyme A thioesterase PaaI-like protein